MEHRFSAATTGVLVASVGMRTVHSLGVLGQLLISAVTSGALTGLRKGELVALRASDLDLDQGTVRVARKFAELQNGRREAGPPKLAAGVRTIAIPAGLVQVMGEHLAEYRRRVRN